jgi:hypothetical protein
MTIIIPMAGLSKRFTDSGYTLPKYMLYAREKSLFNLAVSSFEAYFQTEKFLFIARDVYCTKEFIEKECELLGIAFFEVIVLDKPTRGQAETVYLGVLASEMEDSEAILIFNIDTFRPNFRFPVNLSNWDGYLEVFEGDGANWSYAKTENSASTKVIQTAEKEEISNYCSTGIYYFKKKASFMSAFDSANVDISKIKLKELYVAPLYNYLIGIGQEIHIDIIQREEVTFCGVPAEYLDFLGSIKF